MLWFDRLQRLLIYYPIRVRHLDPAAVSLRAGRLETVTTRTADGLSLNGWQATPGEESAANSDRPGTVLYLPGNNGHRGIRLPEIQALLARGLKTFLFDYRGYAENPGRPSEEGLHLDAKAAWHYLTQVANIPPSQILIYGESLGGAVAVRLAADLCREGDSPRGLVLRSTFASLVETGQHTIKVLPVKYLLYDRFDSISHIGAVTCPIFQYHGEQDRTVPFKHGRHLFDAAPATSSHGIAKRFLSLPNARHHDVLVRGGPLIRNSLIDFLADLSSAATRTANRDGFRS